MLTVGARLSGRNATVEWSQGPSLARSIGVRKEQAPELFGWSGVATSRTAKHGAGTRSAVAYRTGRVATRSFGRRECAGVRPGVIASRSHSGPLVGEEHSLHRGADSMVVPAFTRSALVRVAGPFVLTCALAWWPWLL